MFLLDTDTIIYNFKGSANVRENLQQHLNDPIWLSIIEAISVNFT